MTKQIKTSKDEIKKELWKRGVLKWMLYKHQVPIYDKIREVLNSPDPMTNSYVIDCARQFGKSFIMFMIAVENCLQNANITVVYVGPLKSQVNEIINGNTYNIMFASCPQEFTPKYDGTTLQFTNGSRIRLAGTDNKNYSNLRGGSAHLVLLDEAGFMSDLEVGVLPTVEPMTKTTGGKVIFASTPPDTLDHDYIQILRDHEEAGLISTFTIWDDTSLTPIQLQKIINQCKGKETTKFKREYECQRIIETSVQVIPELTEHLAKRLMIDDLYKRDDLLKFWKKYVVIDTGIRDKTAAIFAHFNYQTKKVVVESMLDLQGSEYNTSRLAEMIKQEVRTLWKSDEIKGIRYIADNNNLIVINDLNIIYKLPFEPTTKGRLDEMVQKVRDWIYDERIQFAPNATEVLNCSRFAIWSKSRTEFSRSPKYGHYDALAALVYLIRNVEEYNNPVPDLIGFNKFSQFIEPGHIESLTKNRNELSSVFYNPRKGISYR